MKKLKVLSKQDLSAVCYRERLTARIDHNRSDTMVQRGLRPAAQKVTGAFLALVQDLDAGAEAQHGLRRGGNSAKFDQVIVQKLTRKA